MSRKKQTKNIQKALLSSAFILLAMLAGALLLAGCVNPEQPGAPPEGSNLDAGGPNAPPNGPPSWQGGPENPSGARGPGGQFGNLTEEQRQQFMQERLQQAQAACQGKADGDACELQMQSGNQSQARNITGTCETLNTTRMCAVTAARGRRNAT